MTGLARGDSRGTKVTASTLASGSSGIVLLLLFAALFYSSVTILWHVDMGVTMPYLRLYCKGTRAFSHESAFMYLCMQVANMLFRMQYSVRTAFISVVLLIDGASTERTDTRTCDPPDFLFFPGFLSLTLTLTRGLTRVSEVRNTDAGTSCLIYN